MDWQKVQTAVDELLKNSKLKLESSQKKAIRKAAKMLVEHGVILADEVGLGKTRVALVIMEAVMRTRGTVAAVVPPGLIYQWESEAKKVFAEIPDALLTRNIIHLRSFENLFSNNNFPLLKANGEKWILASHNFGFWNRITDNNNRYDLFTAIKINQLQRKSEEWKALYSSIELRNTEGLLNAAAFLAEDYSVQQNSIWKKFDKPSESFSLKNEFFGIDEGKTLAFQCIGKLLGSVDFLVVDEAHKSREDSEDNSKQVQKRLSILLENIIDTKKSSRRFCITATPIELHSEQWNDLFGRCKLPKVSEEDNYISKFTTSLVAAQANPESPDVLDDLIRNSKEFKKNLSSCVIRRKRSKSDKYRQRIQKLGLDIQKVNPHIEIRECFIDPESFKEKQLNWKKAIHCFEGMSLACQGADLPQKSKLMRCRYAAGLLDMDDFADEIEQINDCQQKKRIQFWYEQSQKFSKEGNSGNSLYSHPRVLTAAKEIWNRVKETGEKILVFGTFKDPIVTLRNTINALYIIDCIKSKPHKPTTRMGLEYSDIWEVYQQFYSQLSEVELKKTVEDCERLNANRAERLKNNFDNDRICQTLGLENLKEEEKEHIGSQIRADIIDALRDKKTEQDKSKQKKREKHVFEKICSAYINGIKDQLRTEHEQNDIDPEDFSNRKQKIFDALGLGEDRNMSRRRSAFCRLMDGEMRMSTRRVVQELFNNEDALPKVLIAQSSVGREGLNLQEACRDIYIFHPEWNPAVIEQEIGRVDRIGSLWEKMVDEDNCKEKVPKIHVTFVVFKGTYDEYQYNVYKSRKNMLESQLSGVLLADKADRITNEYKKRLAEAAPDFEP